MIIFESHLMFDFQYSYSQPFNDCFGGNSFDCSVESDGEYAQSQDSFMEHFEGENEVKQKIKSFMESIEQYKESTKELDKNIVWKTDYDIIVEDLENIYNMVDNNYVDALNEFNAMEISNFQTFKDFVINTNIKAKKVLKGNLARVKSIRSPRGETLKCKCGGVYHLLGTEFVCDKCGNRRSYDKKMPGSSYKQNMDKHISKQMDFISGVKTLPNNIKILKPYLIKWLVERKYLLEWLRYSGRLDSFCQSMSVSLDWFEENVKRIPENKYTYNQYSAIVNEFFGLFEMCNAINQIQDSNMCSLEDSQKIELCKEFYTQYKRIPEKNEFFKEKQIGNYVNKLFIIPEKNDTEKEIERIFEKQLRVGGLMFDFRTVRKMISAPPKKFNLTSIYTEMMHICFNVQYIILRPNDRIAIEEIIKEFNKYYKAKQEEVRTGKFNSPLFCCTLHCIITRLKYFEVYKDILSIIPDKYLMSKAMTLITSIFILFINDNKEYIDKYRQENTDIITARNFSEEVDKILNDDFEDECPDECLEEDCQEEAQKKNSKKTSKKESKKTSKNESKKVPKKESKKASKRKSRKESQRTVDDNDSEGAAETEQAEAESDKSFEESAEAESFEESFKEQSDDFHDDFHDDFREEQYNDKSDDTCECRYDSDKSCEEYDE